MHIYSFGPEAGHQVSEFGSDFVLCPVMGAGDVARTVFMHIPPGGLVGEHDAASAQLFCVVSGDGWVRGANGQAVPVKAFEAAYWQPGETHAAGTDTGMVAAVIEGTFSVPVIR